MDIITSRRRKLQASEAWYRNNNDDAEEHPSVRMEANGMAIEACLDNCTWDYDLSIQGNELRAYGNRNPGEEWVFLNATTRDVHVMLGGSGTRDGTVAIFWDCDPDACSGSCAEITLAPTVSPAPTLTPALFYFGADECTFTDVTDTVKLASQTVTVTKLAAEDLHVAVVPAGRREVMVHMNFGMSELNLKLEAADSTVLLQFDSTTETWNYDGPSSLNSEVTYKVGEIAHWRLARIFAVVRTNC